jgi:hypothetical protein
MDVKQSSCKLRFVTYKLPMSCWAPRRKRTKYSRSSWDVRFSPQKLPRLSVAGASTKGPTVGV